MKYVDSYSKMTTLILSISTCWPEKSDFRSSWDMSNFYEPGNKNINIYTVLFRNKDLQARAKLCWRRFLFFIFFMYFNRFFFTKWINLFMSKNHDLEHSWMSNIKTSVKYEGKIGSLWLIWAREIKSIMKDPVVPLTSLHCCRL